MFSTPKPVTSGVRQGSVIGPLMFILYVSDLFNGMDRGTNLVQYADDVMLWRKIENADDHSQLQSDLDLLQRNVEEKGLPFNSLKTILLRFTRQRTPDASCYSMGSNTISPSKSGKWLGLTLDPVLLFNEHTDRMIEKAMSRTILLTNRLKGALRKSVGGCFSNFVLSIIRYGMPVYFRETADMDRKLWKPYHLLKLRLYSNRDIDVAALLKIPTPKILYEFDTLLLAFKFAIGSIRGGDLLFRSLPPKEGMTTRSATVLSQHPMALDTRSGSVGVSATKAWEKSFVMRVIRLWNLQESELYGHIAMKNFLSYRKRLRDLKFPS